MTFLSVVVSGIGTPPYRKSWPGFRRRVRRIAPRCEKSIRGWTQVEIDDGLVDVDWDQQDRREAALDRLREQLETPGA